MRRVGAYIAVIFFFVLLLATGVYFIMPGGGGATHAPPSTVRVGEPLHLELEASVWGPYQGRMSKRWTSFVCVYRLIDEAEWQQKPMTIASESWSRLLVRVDIPAFPQSEHAGVEYYITHNFYGNAWSIGKATPGATQVVPYRVMFHSSDASEANTPP